MIVPDVNLLIYAHDRSAPQHRAARLWWETVLSGEEPIGIPMIVVLAFVRLMTHATIAENPMSVEQAKSRVEEWLEQPNCRALPMSDQTLSHFFKLLALIGKGGNLTTDAMIAASALEYGGTVYSNDQDFGRFTDLTTVNPI